MSAATGEPRDLLSEGVTDATDWAEEFTSFFDEHGIIYGDRPDLSPDVYVDRGTAAAWFAAAIETGRRAGEKEAVTRVLERLKEAEKEADTRVDSALAELAGVRDALESIKDSETRRAVSRVPTELRRGEIVFRMDGGKLTRVV